MMHTNIGLCDRPSIEPVSALHDRPYSLRNSSAAALVEALHREAQTAADELAAACCRLEIHESDDTGDAALTDPEDVLALLTPTRGHLAGLSVLARAIRQAAR